MQLKDLHNVCCIYSRLISPPDPWALYSNVGIAALWVCPNTDSHEQYFSIPVLLFEQWGSKSKLLFFTVLQCLFELLPAGIQSSTARVFVADAHPAGCLPSANFVDGPDLGTLVTLRKVCFMHFNGRALPPSSRTSSPFITVEAVPVGGFKIKTVVWSHSESCEEE